MRKKTSIQSHVVCASAFFVHVSLSERMRNIKLVFKFELANFIEQNILICLPAKFEMAHVYFHLYGGYRLHLVCFEHTQV